MKINSTDFPLENRIVLAREDRIYYETEKNSLAEAWDRLMEYYNSKVQEEHREEMEEGELYRMLCAARVEAETGRTIYDLIEKGTLKTYQVKSRHKGKCGFKPLILESCINLLEKGIKELREAILYEERVWEVVERMHLPIRLMHGEIRIYVTETNHMRLDRECRYIYPASWKARGLTCKVRYLSICLECSVPPIEAVDEVEAVKGYFLEKSMIQMFSKGRMEIEISEFRPEGKENALCRCIIEELRSGSDIEDICDKAVLYISRMLVDSITRDCMHRKFLNCSGPILPDGLAEVFFVLAGDKVVKVLRNKPGVFEIFVNEIPTKFSTPSGIVL